MKYSGILFCCLSVAVLSCKFLAGGKFGAAKLEAVEVHGHRGDRGNFPENSVPAFISAVKKGVNAIEMDVVISKDKKVVVSHEPYMSSNYVLTPAGDPIHPDTEQSYNLYEMNYDQIRNFDSGSKGNRAFPQQKKLKTCKPLLSEVINHVEHFLATENLKPVKYNIELKSNEEGYDLYQPVPAVFVELVMEVVRNRGITEHTIIQSFDPNILNYLNRNYPKIRISYLVSEYGIEENLALLEFRPDIYSPDHGLVTDRHFVNAVKSRGMKVIPWTVNTKSEMNRLIRFGVDGVITDYPERILDIQEK